MGAFVMSKQAPPAEEPDQSAFSQHLECSVADVSQRPHGAERSSAAAPDQDARAGSTTSEADDAESRHAFAHISAADVLDYREGGCGAVHFMCFSLHH